MNAEAKQGWADRMGPGARTVAIIVAVILGVFAVGMVGGFSYAVIEDGSLPTKPILYLIFAGMIGLVVLVGWILRSLFRSIHAERMSGFDRRYWKMWMIIIGLSLPIGAAVAVLGLSDQSRGFSLILSNAPIAPLTAILVSIVMTLLLVVAAIIYHRTIDDHEEHAYLWGSTISYYFLILAFPLHWLLARGGLVPTLTIGIALLLILISCLVQAIVWALFKFR